MPELPEVECVRLSLERLVMGRRVTSVRVMRADVITGSVSPAALLVGDRVSEVVRHGKQLALVGSGGGCVSVHLGMSGQLCVVGLGEPAGTTKQRTTSMSGSDWPAHTHVVWYLDGGHAIRFTDPRRFGGVWTFDKLNQLINARWSRLGPDALTITPSQLGKGLSKTRRALKAALLDQHVVAGLGNIYVDELLFKAKLHPRLPADRLDRTLVPGLVRRMKTLLNGAILRGGSSLRDYVDADNQRGSQQEHHRVYGRAGLRCTRRGCDSRIETDQVAGRTTAWCPACQPMD
ncbi:MAG: bifunctional DNA-formamidopyrimidine glycosylase/DNA-(apurinic or apyrimidinic site) lyase [Planctomycetota bacterium]